MSNHDKNVRIATIIRNQIGAGALMMLGAHAIVAIDNGLQFGVRGSSVANKVRITLDLARDTYRVEVLKCTLRACKVVVKTVLNIDDQGPEDLHERITEGTGLATRL